MYRITEKQFNEMPSELQELYEKLPNPSRDEVVGLFPNSKSAGEYKKDKLNTFIPEEAMFPLGYQTNAYAGESGSASRFFYCAKASKRERNIGCEGLEKRAGGSNAKGYTQDVARGLDRNRPVANFHPTVKPLALMEYLVKLVSRERQVVLDPFMGSGTTGMACVNTGRDFIGIEIDEDYFKIAQARIESCKESRQLTFE